MTTYLAAHHEALNAKNTFTKKAEAFFAPHGSSRHMRLAQFAIVICDGDVWAGVAYEDNMLTYREEEWSNPDHLESFARGRLAQVDQVEQNLSESHPMRQAILNAIKLERDYNAA